MTAHSDLKALPRWLCTFIFRKVSVTERMHALPSRFLQYSGKVYNYLKSIFMEIDAVYCHKAAFSKRFSSLTYVLKSSWLDPSSIALLIQSKDLKYILHSGKWHWHIQLLLFHRSYILQIRLLLVPFFSETILVHRYLTLLLLFHIFPEQMAIFVRPCLKCCNNMLC